MRIVHATDIHWTLRPRLGQVLNKRALGSVNQLLGRKKHFDRAVQDALIAHIVALKPDAVVITGDVTTMALDAEFALARACLEPVLQRFPTLILPGNHDRYTRGATRSKRMERHFGDWMAQGDQLARLDIGHVTVLGLDPNRPHLLSSGFLPPAQLEELAALLATAELAERRVLLALHYPVLDRRGAIYDGLEHGLRNAQDLLQVLDEAPTKPLVVFHGHEHHGFRVDRVLGEVAVPFVDCGSSGYAYLPELRRAAAMNVYHVDVDGLRIERFLYDGSAFSPEPGGAYATGR